MSVPLRHGWAGIVLEISLENIGSVVVFMTKASCGISHAYAVERVVGKG